VSKRGLRLASGVLAATVTWLLLSRSVELQRARDDGALLVGGLSFAAYLFTIAYSIYLRSYWFPARSPARVGPFARWMLTIAALSAFGLTVAFAFPELPQTHEGQLFVTTVAFTGVAVGLVLTVTAGGSASSPRAPDVDPPPFLSRALRVAFFIGAVYVAGAFFLGPVFLFHHELTERIDVPACRAHCEARGYTYRSFATRKGGYACICADGATPHAFNEHGRILGGHGTAAEILDGFLRFGASLLIGLGWPALTVLGAMRARAHWKAQ
jgi:hypothetical protein